MEKMISIIVPVYNASDYIIDCLNSVFLQTYSTFEVLAINDGSTDDTHDVLEQLAVEYPSLRVIHLAENQGKALALKTGAAAARSDYLVCIDGDALLDRDAVAYIVDREIAKTLIAYHHPLRAADDWRCLTDFSPSASILMTAVVDHPVIAAGEQNSQLSAIEKERVESNDVPISRFGTPLRYNIAKFLYKKYPQ